MVTASPELGAAGYRSRNMRQANRAATASRHVCRQGSASDGVGVSRAAVGSSMCIIARYGISARRIAYDDGRASSRAGSTTCKSSGSTVAHTAVHATRAEDLLQSAMDGDCDELTIVRHGTEQV